MKSTARQLRRILFFLLGAAVSFFIFFGIVPMLLYPGSDPSNHIGSIYYRIGLMIYVAGLASVPPILAARDKRNSGGRPGNKEVLPHD